MSNIKLVHSGGNSVSLTTPDSNPVANRTFKLPGADGTSGQAMVTDGSGALSFASMPSGGLSMADNWRWTTEFTQSNTTSFLTTTSSWERPDSKLGIGANPLGTGMTQSGGIFSFPSTGYWLVSCTVQIKINTGDSRYSHHYIKYTSDNGSNWSNATRSSSNYLDTGDGNASFGDNHSEKIFDITDTSNQKIKIHVSGTDTDMISLGDSNANYTYIRFIKLAET